MKILNLFFIMLIEASVFLTCAQSTDNGFKVEKFSSGSTYFGDINCEKYKGNPQNKNGKQLDSYWVQYKNEPEQLMILEKSIFSPDERKQVQKYTRKPALVHFLVEAVSGNIVCVSFSFRITDESFRVDTEKLAKYREEIKRNIKLNIKGGEDVVSGYFYQSMRIFIDLDDK